MPDNSFDDCFITSCICFTVFKFLSVFAFILQHFLPFFLHFLVGFPSMANTMSLPIIQTNPTKLMPTSACHVITAFILFNWVLALRTQLILNNLNPFIFIIFNHFCPILNLGTIQRRMSHIATQSTNGDGALAPDWFHSQLQDQKLASTFNIRAYLSAIIFTRIKDKQEVLKLLLNGFVIGIGKNDFHEFIVHESLTVLSLTAWKQGRVNKYTSLKSILPAFKTKFMSTRISEERNITQTHFTRLRISLFDFIMRDIEYHFLMGALPIHELINYIFVPMGGIVKKEGPIIFQASKIHNLFYFFINLDQNSI